MLNFGIWVSRAPVELSIGIRVGGAPVELSIDIRVRRAPVELSIMISTSALYFFSIDRVSSRFEMFPQGPVYVTCNRTSRGTA